MSLGTLGGVQRNGYGGSANDINDAGWIVGTSITEDAQRAAFLYKDGQMHDLNELLVPSASTHWVLQQGFRINENGQILAFGYRTGSRTPHSLLLSPAPVPEPSAYALMLAGLGLVGWLVKRRPEPQNSVSNGCSAA